MKPSEEAKQLDEPMKDEHQAADEMSEDDIFWMVKRHTFF